MTDRGEKDLGPELDIIDPDAPEPSAEEPEAEGEPEPSQDAQPSEPSSEERPELAVEETSETKKAFEKHKKEEETKPKGGASQLVMIFAVFAVLFVMLQPNLRAGLGHVVGFGLDPTLVAAFGQWPVLVLFFVGIFMVGLSTLVRHFFVDWLDMARTQNYMRAFQKEFREARMAKDNARIQKLQKMQPEIMQMQTKMSGSQMRPMLATMVVIIPLFAWLWEWVSTVHYPYYTTPWNDYVYLFGTSLLPHWILLYSLLTIPFGNLVQKALKVWSWRHRIRELEARSPAGASG